LIDLFKFSSCPWLEGRAERWVIVGGRVNGCQTEHLGLDTLGMVANLKARGLR